MDKLSKFAQSNSQAGSVEGSQLQAINKDLDIFRLFKKYTDKIIEE